MADIVLERIRHPGFQNTDPAFPEMIEIFVSQGLFDGLVEIVVVGEEDVAADVPGETLNIEKRGGEAAYVETALE
jgi:hypothetical protein